ncbi:unnamed protein product, partial [Mesorhabditis spiculigera]
MTFGVTTIVHNKYMISKKIGAGAYGAVWELRKVADPRQQLALKTEGVKPERAEEFLKIEYEVMDKLRAANSLHSPRLVGAGKTDTQYYIVMTLLGPSLADLRKCMPGMKFSPFTSGMCYIQCLDAIIELHQLGYVHRDIKPGNFAVGKMNTAARRWVYLFDFGLCRRIFFDRSDAEKKYKKCGDKRLRTPRKQCKMVGTLRYCSMNAHHKEELGRHDDVWSLWFAVAEWHLGELPWSGVDKAKTEMLKVDVLDDLVAKMPAPLGLVVKHLRGLRYHDEPNYALLRGLGASFLHDLPNYNPGDPLDWEPAGCHAALYKHMHNCWPPDPDPVTLPPLVIEKPPKNLCAVKSLETVHQDPDSQNSYDDETNEGIKSIKKGEKTIESRKGSNRALSKTGDPFLEVTAEPGGLEEQPTLGDDVTNKEHADNPRNR